ncbi:uncharacterized protein IUM83_07645 [Phytophthora cinnamomi]|uniref:uncharacterized protein n=1 Tax=Phytophthora cinnamomi TaxID=4785 RepID=UPI00355A7490|nr:hypothetical protein IUM83_07645 [Phytophthora cinnamomi]
MATSAHDVVPFEGRFPSWEAFDVARKAHCEKTYTMYVCRNTVKVAVANKRRKLQVPDSWVYDRKIYVCTHGYRRVSRSGGSRPRQNVRYTDCKARFTACVASELTEDGGETVFIKVTGQHLIHNDHPVSLEQWRMYSQNRAAVIEHPYLTHEADLMRRIGSNKKATRAHIEALTGKACTMKDMHNLYARLKKRDKRASSMDASQSQQPPHTTASIPVSSGASQGTIRCHSGMARVEHVLQSFVDADMENHASILSADDGSNEAICLASRAMKEHFQVFSELVVLDATTATQSTTQTEQCLHGFLSMDALGNARPVFLARSLAMSTSLLRRVCQDFKRTHPKWMHTKVLVMSKLLPDVVQVLAIEFPQAQLLLCQFHVLQLLNDLLAHSQIPRRISNKDKMRDCIQQLVFAHSESRYNEAKALLVRQLVIADKRELLDTFDRTWEPYRAFWASYARAEQFDFLPFLTKGMKSYWEPMQNKTTREKHILHRDGSTCDCAFFALYYLPCRHLIWYEVVALQHKQLSMAAVGPRWFLRSFQAPKLASQRESNEIEYHLL